VTGSAVQQLEALARSDGVVAPLALLQAEALRATADLSWEEGVPALSRQRVLDGLVLLHGQTLRVSVERAERLLARLAGVAEETGHPEAGALRKAVDRHAVDVPSLLVAGIVQDGAALHAMAEGLGIGPGPFASLAQQLVLPILQACGRKAAPLLADTPWEAGYCPVCAAWPTLAEVRGLERKRWLRCGRCGASWPFPHQRCAFCGNADHRTLGYLAPEADRESRRVETCDRCLGYLKSVSSVGPLTPGEVLLRDLATLELDMAALEREYAPPSAPGFPLEVRVEARRRGLLWW